MSSIDKSIGVKMAGPADDQQDKPTDLDQYNDSKTVNNNRAATLFQLFSFADSLDIFFMFIGSLGGIVTGCSLPIFCILFGQMLDSLNKGSSIKSAVEKVVIDFVIISAVNLASGFIQVRKCG